MTGFSFDSNIIIDALAGFEPAHAEIRKAIEYGSRAWISRMVWVEVLSKGSEISLGRTRLFLSGFGVDELDEEIANRAAAIRRERSKLRAADAIIFASAQVRGRVLVTRNTKDFPVTMLGVRVPYIF